MDLRSQMTRINIKQFVDEYMSAIPLDLFIALQDKLINGQTHTTLLTAIVEAVQAKSNEIKREEIAMKKCTNLNNLGIQQEKLGNIDYAIKLYEENINSTFIACHSFDRLMILYRQKKEYNNEIRVINKALDVLCKRYPQLKDKYLKRLENAKQLKNKNK